MAEERGAQTVSKHSSVRKDGRFDSNEEVKYSRRIEGGIDCKVESQENGKIGRASGGEGEKHDGLVLTEIKLQCRLAWPIIFTNLLTYSYIIVSVMFVGHLGELELSSASIANSFATVSGFSVMLGLASAMETLCGQAYGAKRYHQVGVYLQTGWMVTFSFCIPILLIWFNMERILLAIGQDPEISRMAASYLQFMMPGMFSSAFTQPLVKYFQVQFLVVPMMINALITAILHPFLCYTLIYVFGLGFYGGALSTTLSFYVLAILNLGYALCSKKCRKCWGGLALREAVGSIGMYLTLAVPSVVMFCFEFWAFELVVLSCGLLPKPSLELSLLTISLNTVNFSDMIPLGLCVAASIRVSNELGANRPDAASLALKVALGLAVFDGSIVSVTLLLLRNTWGHAFTNISEVLEYVAEVTPLLALLVFMDAIAAVLSGVVRGSGRQAFGASINLAAYYVIGLPACLLLGFKLHFNGKGLLMGVAFAIFMQMTFLLILNSCTDWKKTAKQAQDRVSQGSAERQPLLPSHLTSQKESSQGTTLLQ